MVLMIRPYSHSDYETICKWLAFHQIPKPAYEYFSPTGFVANEKAVGFLFRTPSKVCFIDQVAADPFCTKEERADALDELFQHIEAIAENEGFGVVTILASLPALKHRLTKRHFVPHGDFTYFLKLLGGSVCRGH